MSDQQGAWIAPALAFHERLSQTPKLERPRAYQEESTARGVTALTLRRTVTAARYCAKHAKSVDLRIEDVAAATLAVELLIRLERRDRSTANELRKAVFEGRVSVRKMREHLKSVPEKRPRGRALNEWGAFALSIIEQCYLDEIESFETGENSAMGKLLKVDIEVQIGSDVEPHAIFISPLDEYSECAGLTIDDQIPFILAAGLRYPRINVVLHEQNEAERLATVLSMLRQPLAADIRLVSLFDPDEF